MATLDSKIDDLYRGTLDEFTAARNALAKTLTGADASRVRKLAKPTVVPFALNQLYWHDRPAFERLVTSGARLRKAQIDALEGRRADVRAAGDAHRTAIAHAVKEATRLASAAGVHPAADALTRTIETLSLMPEPPDPPGRLTEALQPAGFEALAGIPVRAPAPKPTATEATHEPRERREPREPTKKDREEARRREAAARAHAAAVAKAEATLVRAQAAAKIAREAADRAEEAVASARTELERLRANP